MGNRVGNFSAKEMENIGIRLRYRGEPEHVSVPVDVKLGMAGKSGRNRRSERKGGMDRTPHEGNDLDFWKPELRFDLVSGGGLVW